jgi:hypothetical protein
MTAPPSALVVVQGDHVAWAAMAGWNTIAVEQDYIIHYTMKPNCFVSFIASSKGMPPSSPTSVPSTNRDALCREELHLTPSPARTSIAKKGTRSTHKMRNRQIQLEAIAPPERYDQHSPNSPSSYS